MDGAERSCKGDADTLTAIAGSMAEAFYGISEQFKMWAYELTTEYMHEVMKEFEGKKMEKMI